MNKYFIWIFLLAIGNTILFAGGKEYGISVMLFIVPLLIFLIYVLKEKNLIKNKYGLLLAIPIFLLALTYFIFNNTFFFILNFLVILVLLILMYIVTIKGITSLSSCIKDFFSLIFMPFNYIGNVLENVTSVIEPKLKISNKTKRIIKSLAITLPVVFIILVLLSSADLVFSNLFSSVFDVIDKMVEEFSFYSFFGKCIRIFLLFLYMSVTVYFIINHYSKEKNEQSKEKNRDDYTIKLLLTLLNIIYIVFDIIQVKSLLFHSLSEVVNYAQYARQGFFELMFVSFINLTIILISKKGEKKKDKYINFMSLFMIFLTFIIIISAFLRMYLYEQAYGYTLLRLLVYIALFTEVILLIPTIRYIINPKAKIIRDYIVIIVTVYTFINFINIDSIIAKRNIERYDDTSKIDLIYLENGTTDNVSNLISLYNKVEDKKIKNELKDYLTNLNTSIEGFQEYNLSKVKAKKLIEKVED